MSSRAKFQNNSFVRHIVSSKNVKGTFLTSKPLNDVFSKILFCSNQVSHGTSRSVEFQDRRSNSLGREESQRNHRSECIIASLAPLNK